MLDKARAFRRYWRYANLVFASISAGSLLAMMAIGASDLAMRFFFNAPIAGATEVITILMPLVILLAFSLIQERDKHIKVELIVDRLPSRWRAVCDIFALLLGTMLAAVISFETLRYAGQSFEIREYLPGPINVPLYPSKFLAFVGYSALTVQFLISTAERCNRALNAPAQATTEMEVSHG